MGDGVTALFGLEVEAKEANQQALRAATQVDRRFHALGNRLAQELRWAADCVIHLHTGPAGVGETGDNVTRTLASVGNTIDVARQLAAQHDDAEDARIVVSEALMIAADYLVAYRDKLVHCRRPSDVEKFFKSLIVKQANLSE